jgi:hypothetical protein
MGRPLATPFALRTYHCAAANYRSVGASLRITLVAKTEVQYGLILCSGILYGPGLYPCILVPDICSGFLHVPRITYGPGRSVLLHGPRRCWGIFHDGADASWTSWLSLAAIFGQHRIFSAQALQSNLEAR